MFAQIVNTNVEYNVFLTKEGKGDIWISEKTPSYFIVKGTPGLQFSYEVKAKRKHYENVRLDPHNKATGTDVGEGNPFNMVSGDGTYIGDMAFDIESEGAA